MFAGQAIAVKVSGDPTSSNNGIFYFHNDHLGSTSVLTKDSDGYVLDSSVVRYLPFGGYRDAGAQDLTDRGYTGHKENLDIGLIYMNARFYVSGIAHFASADTIVPDPANPQSFNRYSYVENRPLNFSDPSGHIPCEEMPTECRVGNNGAENWTVGSQSTNQFANAFPYFFVGFLERVGKDVQSVATAYELASQNTLSWLIDFNGESSFTRGVKIITGNITDSSNLLPSDFLGNTISSIIAMSHLASAEAQTKLGDFYARDLVRVRSNTQLELYRGLQGNHQGVEAFNKTGIVSPRGGGATVEEHVLGNTESIFTSWTTDPQFAMDHAGPGGTVLTVNTADIPNHLYHSYTWSPFFWEAEVTIQGPIIGAEIFK